MARLEGKVALITGGAGGIGSTAAKLFIDEGAKVVIADLSAEALQKVADDINSPNLAFVTCNVAVPAENTAAVKMAVDSFGGLDILLANAGVEGVVKPITEYPHDVLDLVIDVNIKGPFYGIQAAFPEMVKRGGGSIVITSSVAGLEGSPMVTPYSTSKHAVVGLMRSAAKEGARFNIRVNTVNPSPVDNRMMRSLEEGYAPGHGDAAKGQFAASIPLGRYADNMDIAKVMLHLASDDSKFVTGTVNPVDGGMTA